MSDFEHPPILRHDALVPFSRDHYVGLVQARHLINAADADPIGRRRVVSEFLDAWRCDILVHLEDEERLLLPFMDEADSQRMLVEHRRLAELAAELQCQRTQVSPDADLLRQVGSLLKQHIRWEERELFNRLQDQVGPSALLDLRSMTAEIESTRDRDTSRTRIPYT